MRNTDPAAVADTVADPDTVAGTGTARSAMDRAQLLRGFNHSSRTHR
jgi:hypothetical protein